MLYFELSDLYQFNIKVSIFMFKILFFWRSNCSVKMFLKSFVGKLLIRQMFSHAAAISSIFCYLIYINLYWSIYITLYLLNAYLILSYNPEIKIGFIWAFYTEKELSPVPDVRTGAEFWTICLQDQIRIFSITMLTLNLVIISSSK